MLLGFFAGNQPYGVAATSGLINLELTIVSGFLELSTLEPPSGSFIIPLGSGALNSGITDFTNVQYFQQSGLLFAENIYLQYNRMPFSSGLNRLVPSGSLLTNSLFFVGVGPNASNNSNTAVDTIGTVPRSINYRHSSPMRQSVSHGGSTENQTGSSSSGANTQESSNE